MLFAKLEIDETLYVFLHAEQVYRDFSRCDKDLGCFRNDVLEHSDNDILEHSDNDILEHSDNDILEHSSYNITESTMRDIYKYIEGNATPVNIIIDCAEIKNAINIAGWIKKIIKHCKENGRNLSFCRMGDTLYGKSRMRERMHEKTLEEQPNDDKTCNVFISGRKKKNINENEIFEIYQQEIAKRIKSNYIIERKEGEESYSHSSNVQLPIYINIKAFIEQKDFSFLGLYLLCKQAIREEFIEYGKHPLLFFSSMAGAYLASVFSKLACIDMVFLNHLGPKKKLYRELHKEQLLADRDYLIISDVVCLGAEIERAKTLIEHAGGKLKGILSVVYVEVVSERPKTENEIKKVALLTLTKDYNPIDYQIITDFPKK